jgi:SAM-dependent methyltransferase
MLLRPDRRNAQPASGSAWIDAVAARGILELAFEAGYHFTTPTPLTHARVLANRAGDTARNLRDVLGWNLPFESSVLPPAFLSLMQRSGLLSTAGGQLRSKVRIASIGNDLFLHSAYPSTASDAVFFGPDTYRFVRLIHDTLRNAELEGSDFAVAARARVLRVLDLGCGSGAGGIVAARVLSAMGAQVELVMNDINPAALAFTGINTAAAGLTATLAEGNGLAATSGEFDLIVCNPPYLHDAAARTYRHGGERLGRALGVRLAAQAMRRLAPGGMLVLYTGVAIVDGSDLFLAEIQPELGLAHCSGQYSEIDPDVFGEELEGPAYAQVERIAAVSLVAQRELSMNHHAR